MGELPDHKKWTVAAAIVRKWGERIWVMGSDMCVSWKCIVMWHSVNWKTTVVVLHNSMQFLWNGPNLVPNSTYMNSFLALPRLNNLSSNFNSLIFFENYYWPFNLDWLFEIWTDLWFFQNLIWGLGYYRCTDQSGKFVSGPRGSKAHWENLMIKYFEDYKDIYNLRLVWYLTSNYSIQFLLAIFLCRDWVHLVIDQ